MSTTIAETNARATARRQLKNWLYKRYQRLDLIEMADEPDPISLRQIFVPMQAATEDINDDDMGKPDKVESEQLSGQAVWDLLIQESFLAISGRPGSGKTTVVQAIVVELCGSHNSALRKQLNQKQPGILPLPIILRHIPNIDMLADLDALLDKWWNIQAEQALADNKPLDLERLRQSFSQDKTPVLMLFDGIDEVGGPKTRQHVLNLALQAHDRGYRILVTGRPSGYQDLSNSIITIYHLLPLAWPQIQVFIQTWYQLRKEWQIKQQQGVSNFLAALQDQNRPHLLILSRRAIFLALMALVHCTRNEMPYGRADLYKSIIDLYLHRQEQHRQIQHTVQGKPMPHWDVNEPRLVLGHLAWLSQQKASDLKRSKYDPDVRRVVWTRSEMLTAISTQLDKGPGRFTSLEPEDSSKLLNFFLHPAGLLVEPAEDKIQFAHLSFQEYLCAEFLYERGDIEGLRNYLESHLWPQLTKLGWDEVGMLLLSVRAMKTRNEGHFELLSWLNPVDVGQADLLVNALSGDELSFTAKERLEWLPVLLGAALIHPKRQYGKKLANQPDFETTGLALLTQFFQASDDIEAWQVLVNAVKGNKHNVLTSEMQQRWEQPKDDDTWQVKFTAREARAHALLHLLNQSGWLVAENQMNPIADLEMQYIIAKWLKQGLKYQSDLLWSRDDSKQPVMTLTGFELDILLPSRGEFWKTVITHLPVDVWLLQGESIDYWFASSLISVLLTLYPLDEIPKSIQLALQLYQVLICVEAAGSDSHFDYFLRLRVMLLERVKQMKGVLRLRDPELDRVLVRLQVRELVLMQELVGGVKFMAQVSLLAGWIYLPLLRNALEKIKDYLKQNKPNNAILEPLSLEMVHFGYRYIAQDWFKEQAEKPDLMLSRGLHPYEPLPKELGLFDDQGLPLKIQSRDNWLKLQQWLNDDEAVLKFTFPEGLTSSEHQSLLAELSLLHQQPWSPYHGVAAILADWPETEIERDHSLEAAEQRLLQACQRFLSQIESNQH
jgi:hypothetical protein